MAPTPAFTTTRFIASVACASMLGLVSFTAGTARAQTGNDALWYYGNSGYTSTVAILESAFVGAGASGVDQTATWPASLTSYHLVFLVMPQSSFDAGQIGDLQAYTAAGGLLVLVADSSSFGSVFPVIGLASFPIL